jgi:CDP-diacylglycerol---glycerol-3-phosphate 3-phosphatidyltransferase
VKTTLQGVALSGLCLPLPHGDAHGGAFDVFGVPGTIIFYLSQVLLAAAVAMTMWSGYEFFVSVREHRRGVNTSTPLS